MCSFGYWKKLTQSEVRCTIQEPFKLEIFTWMKSNFSNFSLEESEMLTDMLFY